MQRSLVDQSVSTMLHPDLTVVRVVAEEGTFSIPYSIPFSMAMTKLKTVDVVAEVALTEVDVAVAVVVLEEVVVVLIVADEVVDVVAVEDQQTEVASVISRARNRLLLKS